MAFAHHFEMTVMERFTGRSVEIGRVDNDDVDVAPPDLVMLDWSFRFGHANLRAGTLNEAGERNSADESHQKLEGPVCSGVQIAQQ